jgi:protein TonB
VGGALLGAVIVIVAAIAFFTGRAPAGGAAMVSQGQSAEAGRNFHVEVIDLRNRRMILSNEIDKTSSPPVTQALAAQAAPAALPASIPQAVPPSVTPPRRSSSPARTVSDLTIRAPRQQTRTVGTAAPQEIEGNSNITTSTVLDPRLAPTDPSNQPRPPQAPAQTLLPKSGLQQAVLVKRVEPVYSAMARQARAQGTVQIGATIGTDGVPKALKFVGGDQRLAQSAIDAIRFWRYKPAELDGQPIETQIIVAVEFRLN